MAALVMRFSTWALSSPWNSRISASISHSTTAAANTSDRRSSGSHADLLGGHVRQLPLGHPGLGDVRPQAGLGDAEVQHPGHPVDADHDVLGRDVPVDDVQRPPGLAGRLVRGVQPVQHAGDHADRDRRGDARARAPARSDQPRQRLAVDVLHDQQQLAVVDRDHVQRSDHVAVLDPGRQAGLVQEHRHEIRITSELRVQPLDGYCSAKAPLAAHPPEKDARHTPRGDLVMDRVASDDRFAGQGRRDRLHSSEYSAIESKPTPPVGGSLNLLAGQGCHVSPPS